MLDEKGRERNPRLKSLTDFIGGEIKEGILDTAEKQKAYCERWRKKAEKLSKVFNRCHQLSLNDAEHLWFN